MKKKVISAALAGTLAVSLLSACGASNEPQNISDVSSAASSEATSTTASSESTGDAAQELTFVLSNIPDGLAIMSIVLIEYSGIHAKGGKRFVHSLAEPIALMTPMNILEIAIRPTSLCMRLFRNVLGAFVIMELIKLVVPAFVPAIFSLYFDLFDGLIQTYVFVFLTSLFMKETME